MTPRWSTTLDAGHVLHHEPAADEAEQAGQNHGARCDQQGAAQAPLVGQPAEDGGRNRVTQGVDKEDVDRKGLILDGLLPVPGKMESPSRVP